MREFTTKEAARIVGLTEGRLSQFRVNGSGGPRYFDRRDPDDKRASCQSLDRGPTPRD